jgi:hypothetical protein
MNTTRRNLGGAGADNTIAIAFGGYTSPGAVTGATEEWNGVIWTEVADLNTAREALGNAGTSATNADALAFGGTPPVTAATEEWSSSSTVTKTVDAG